MTAEKYEHGTCLGCGVKLERTAEHVNGVAYVIYHCGPCGGAYAQRPNDARAVAPGWNRKPGGGT